MWVVPKFRKFLLWFKYLFANKTQIDNIIKSRQDLLQIFDGLSDPIVVIDENFIIKRTNRSTLLTLSKKMFREFIGKHCYAVLHGRQEVCPNCTALETFETDQKTTRIGFIEAKANPHTTTYDITVYPMSNKENNRVTLIAEHYRDTTRLMELSRQLYESERARVMEPLAAGLAHQIRQPLTVIRSEGQYLKDKINKTENVNELRDSLDESLGSIIEHSDIINDVLSHFMHFAKPNHFEMKNGSLVKVFEKALGLIKQRIRDQKITLIKHWSKDPPPPS